VVVSGFGSDGARQRRSRRCDLVQRKGGRGKRERPLRK
jgi:hypothetical protein